MCSIAFFDERRPPFTGVVSFTGSFDFDDIGAEITSSWVQVGPARMRDISELIARQAAPSCATSYPDPREKSTIRT